jgi:hypothetical protein
LRSLQEVSRILWRRPRPKLGYGAKERRKRCFFMGVKLGEEYRLRLFRNRMLRRIFGRKWEEVAGDWR